MIYLQSIFATVVDPVLCDFMYTTWFCLEHVSLYFLFTFPVPSIDFRFTFPVGTFGCTAALYASLTSRDLLMTSTNHAQDCSEMPSKIRRTNVRKRYLCLKTIFNPYQIRIQKISVSPFSCHLKIGVMRSYLRCLHITSEDQRCRSQKMVILTVCVNKPLRSN